MIDFILNILCGMTHGYYVNIGSSDNTDLLSLKNKWEGIKLGELKQPLHYTLEENRCPTLLHYVTIGENINTLLVLKEFFNTVNNIAGWKRRIIILKVPADASLKEYLLDNFYTFIKNEETFDYYIHNTWDILL